MTGTLHERLAERIAAFGPLSFADFVEAALYDPEQGFFADPPIGAARHFVTSPHVSPMFARLLARQVEDAWDVAGRPPVFVIVDAGAGDGTFLRGLRASLPPALRESARLVGVERMAAARRAMEESGLATTSSLSELDDSSVGFLIANELLDNLPFRRVRAGSDGSLREVRVGLDGSRFVEVEVEASPTLEALSGPLEPGHERTVSAAIDATVRHIARVLAGGYAMIIDYDARDGWLPVGAYRDHHAELDLVAFPGSRDVTAGVDFERLVAAAERTGMRVWGPWRQRSVLTALGFQGQMRALRSHQWELEAQSQWRASLSVFSERQAASVLVDPSGLGGLTTLVLSSREAPAPAAGRCSGA